MELSHHYTESGVTNPYLIHPNKLRSKYAFDHSRAASEISNRKIMRKTGTHKN